MSEVIRKTKYCLSFPSKEEIVEHVSAILARLERDDVCNVVVTIHGNRDGEGFCSVSTLVEDEVEP